MSLKVGELFGTLNLDDGPFHRVLGAAGSGMANLTKLAGAAAIAGGVAMVAGAGVAAASIIKIGMSYQDSLNLFKAVTSATGDQMAQVGALAKDLGNDLTLPGISAADAAVAMTQLAKAGLTVEQSMAAAKGVLQLSRAAEVDVGTAADMTAAALNAFSLSGDQAVRVADLLAAAANSSMGEITDMGYAMSQSAAIFASAGVSVEDLTASIAMLANKGILGSDAGTSLKTMLMSLQAPTGAAKTALDGLGVSLYNADGSTRGYRETIDSLSKALAPLTDAQKAQAIETIFGSDAARAANIIFGQGVEAFDKSREAVTKQGAAAEVAAAKSAGLSGAWENIKSTLETIAIGIFEDIQQPLENACRWAGEEIPKAFDKIKAWWDENGPAIEGYIKGVIGKLEEMGKLAVAAYGSTQDGEPEPGKGDGSELTPPEDRPKPPPSTFEMLMPMPEDLNVWTLLGILMDKLVVSGGLLGGLFKTLLPIFTAIGNVLGSVVAIALVSVVSVINIFIFALDKVISTILFLVQHLGILGTVASMTFQMIVTFAQFLGQESSAAFWGIYNAAAGAFGSIVGAVGGAMSGALDKVSGIGESIKNFFSDAGSWLVDAGTRIIQGLIDGMDGLKDAVGNKISEIAGDIRDRLPFSPAKKGPLSGSGNPFFSGLSIANLLAEGLSSGQGALASAVNSVAGNIQLGMASPASSGLAIVPSTSSTSNTFNITINAANGDDAYNQFMRRFKKDIGLNGR